MIVQRHWLDNVFSKGGRDPHPIVEAILNNPKLIEAVEVAVQEALKVYSQCEGEKNQDDPALAVNARNAFLVMFSTAVGNG